MTFFWGTASSSVQTEGASPADTWSARERAGHAPASGTGTGFGQRFAEDFARLADLGLTDHRLSISWARVRPEPDRIDHDAVEHYRRVLRAGRSAGLRIWVTLLHTATPLWFAGFTGPAGVRQWHDWVALAAALFGDVAGGWKPINNPAGFALKGYLAGSFPPGVRDPELFDTVLRTVTRAEFDAGLALADTGLPRCSIEGLAVLHPADGSAAAVEATRRLDDAFWAGWLRWARDPAYAGAFDHIGVSYYITARVDGAGTLLPYPAGAPAGPLGYAPWPGGLGDVLERLERELPGRSFVVAELGYGGADTERVAYLESALAQVRAARAAGISVDGLFFWTDVDNYEWNAGFDVPFGLFDADRRPKPSADLVRTLTSTGIDN